MPQNFTLYNLYNRFPATFTALLSLFVSLCSSMPMYIANGGFFLNGDYSSQYIPFFIETRRILENGICQWDWNCGYGANFIATYSYYTLFNPFSIIILLFPPQYTADAMYFVMLLKFAVGAYIAFYYLRLFVDKHLSTLGSLLYMYSSYIISIISYYNFMDAAVLYPLILISIERFIMLHKRDYGYIAFAFFINAISHYYLFVGSVIGTIFYCIIRLFSQDWKNKTGSQIFYVICSSVLGTLLASFIFLPALSAISGGARVSQPISVGITNIPVRLLSFLFPLDGYGHSLIPWGGNFPPSCCLPVVNIIFALAYIIKRPTSWLSIIIGVFTAALVTPYLSGIFNLYTEPAYSRWLYMPSLMLSLATVSFLQKYEYKCVLTKRIFRIVTAILVITILSVHSLIYLYRVQILPLSLQAWCDLIINKVSYPITTARGLSIILLIALNTILCFILLYGKNIRVRHFVLFVCVSAVALFSVHHYNYFLYMCRHTQTIEYKEPSTTMTHRYMFDSHKIYNSGLYTGVPTLNYYHSILNKSLTPLVNLNQIKFSWIDVYDDASAAFSSVKYRVKDNNSTPYPGKIISKIPYENYIPMGYTYDSYITESDAYKWHAEQDSCNMFHLMLATLVLPDSIADTLPACLIPYSIPDTLPSISALATQRCEKTCSEFIGTGSGFSAVIELDKQDVVFFSVPYDEGFTIKVNGVKQTPIKANLSFMGIVCPQGRNHIEATYSTPLLREGVILSTIAFALLISFIVIYNNKKPNKKE